MQRRSDLTGNVATSGVAAAVLDQARSHHDMGFNDILVDDRFAFHPGLKE
jgi:hypothetical protein